MRLLLATHRLWALVLTWALGLASCAQQEPAEAPSFFDAGRENHLGLTFGPDYDTAFWVAWDGAWGNKHDSAQHIYTATRKQGTWSEPVLMPFSGPHSDSDPFVSPDGRWLYFVSERPSTEGGASTQGDIWRYGLQQEGPLERLPLSSDGTEYSPVVTQSGALYFASDRPGGKGRGDLYRAAAVNDGFAEPTALGSAFNLATGEWNLWVSADESEIVFEASSRSTNVAVPGDLYYSWKAGADWAAAISIDSINTAHSELMARLTPDGTTLLFTRAPIGGNARIEQTPWDRVRMEARANYAPLLLVANRSSHEVTWVDLAQGQIIGRVDTGHGPHLLSNVSAGRIVVSGFGEFPQPHREPVSKRPPFVTSHNSRVMMIDVSDQSVVWNVTLEACPTPHASWIVDELTFVTCESQKQVVKLASQTGEMLGTLNTQQPGSHVLSFEPASRTLAVSNTVSGSVTLFDLDKDASEIVKLDKGSEGALAVDNTLWIANALAGSVSVVDPITAGVLAQTSPICQFPISVGYQGAGKVWIACFASSELVSVDTDTYEVGERIPLPDQPLHVLLHPTRPLAYVSYPRANAVAEISLEAGEEVRRIPVGIEPDGLRWAR